MLFKRQTSEYINLRVDPMMIQILLDLIKNKYDYDSD